MATLPRPDMGDAVQYQGKYYLVTSAEETASLNDAAKFSIELTWWPHIDLAPAEESLSE